MRTWCIYRHINKINGKCYVGQTCQELRKRWRDGKNYTFNETPKFAKALEEFGWDNFEHQVLVSNIPTLKDANILERYYIKYFDSILNGYNTLRGGDGGHIVSEESKKLMSEIGKKTWQTHVHPMKEKIGPKNHRYGCHLSEETKEKIRQKNLMRPPFSEETRNKMRLAKLGKKGAKRSEETKEKLRQQKIGSKNPMYGRHTNNRPESKKPVLQFDLNGNFIQEWESINAAGRALNRRANKIGDVCKNIRRTSYGYIWKFKENKDGTN